MFSSTQGIGRRRWGAAVVGLSAVVLVPLTGCASAQQSGATSSSAGAVPSRLDSALYQKAVAAAKQITGTDKLDKSIEMIGVNGGAEGDVLKGVYKAFTDPTGTKINYTGTQDENSIVQSRVAAGNPPEVVDQAIGVGGAYSARGKPVDLGEVIGADKLKATFGESLVKGASVNGKTFGIYQGFNNFMVWYNPQTYTGPKQPKTWNELVQYTDQRAAQGKQ